jgi:dihydrofolate reductase
LQITTSTRHQVVLGRVTFERVAKEGFKKNNWRDESGATRVLKSAADYTLSGARKGCSLSAMVE